MRKEPRLLPSTIVPPRKKSYINLFHPFWVRRRMPCYHTRLHKTLVWLIMATKDVNMLLTLWKGVRRLCVWHALNKYASSEDTAANSRQLKVKIQCRQYPASMCCCQEHNSYILHLIGFFSIRLNTVKGIWIFTSLQMIYLVATISPLDNNDLGGLG